MEVKHIAIVGFGSMGRRHLRLIKRIRPETEVTLVRSCKGQKCSDEKIADRSVYSIQAVIDLGVQAAIISSPATFHLKQAKEFISAGAHLLVEKPLSNDLVGVPDFVTDASQSGVICLTGYVFRYDQAAQKFREMLTKGYPGHLLYVRVECGSYLPGWRPGLDYRECVSARSDLGGGVLLELSHELDYVCWFFGYPRSVYAYLMNSGTLGLEVEESADLVLESEMGMPISVHLDFNRRHTTRFCTLYGAAGTLTWDAVQKQVSWLPAGRNPEILRFDYGSDDMYVNQLRHFLCCIEKGSEPAASFNDGEKALRLVDAARRSHATGRRVDLG
jgi:predicted dehydrogenase